MLVTRLPGELQVGIPAPGMLGVPVTRGNSALPRLINHEKVNIGRNWRIRMKDVNVVLPHQVCCDPTLTF